MPSERISETVSEKTPRGRPARFRTDTLAVLKALNPDVTTRRGLLDLAYRQNALGVLMDDPEFRWLCDPDGMERGAPGAWRPGILRELGKIEDEEDLKAVARRVCELKPSVKEAVGMIRRLRLGPARPGNALELTDALIRAIDAYLARHPATTWQQVHAALENARDAVAEAEGEALGA